MLKFGIYCHRFYPNKSQKFQNGGIKDKNFLNLNILVKFTDFALFFMFNKFVNFTKRLDRIKFVFFKLKFLNFVDN